MTSTRKPALWFAVFVVFIDALGMSIIFPIMPDLLEELTGRSVGETALIGGWLMVVYGLNQFLFGPIVGALSDTYGRRPVILLALSALCLDYILMAMAWNVWLLFLGRFLAGLSGASHTAASAYIVDVSEREKRGANLGLIGAAFGIGFVIGPAIGGAAAEFGTRAPLYLAAGLCFVGVLFGYFFMPESLAPENNRPFSLRDANPFSSLTRAFKLPNLRPLLMVMVLFSIADMTYPAIWSYWGKESFGWTTTAIAVTLTIYGVLTAIVQGGLIRIVIAKFGEPRTVWIGMGFAISAFFLFPLAPSTWVVVAIIPISAGSHVAGAALAGLMTREVSDSVQGELQGVLGSIQAVSSIVASLGMTTLFFALTAPGTAFYFPGGPFVLAGVLTLIALIPLRMGLKRLAIGAAT